MSGGELHGVVGIPRGFEFLISVAGEKNLRVVPKQAPVAIGFRPEENLPPNEAVVRIDSGIRVGSIAAERGSCRASARPSGAFAARPAARPQAPNTSGSQPVLSANVSAGTPTLRSMPSSTLLNGVDSSCFV